jgi:hypothetical protein
VKLFLTRAHILIYMQKIDEAENAIRQATEKLSVLMSLGV